MKEDKLEKLMRDIGLQHLLVTKVPINGFNAVTLLSAIGKSKLRTTLQEIIETIVSLLCPENPDIVLQCIKNLYCDEDAGEKDMAKTMDVRKGLIPLIR